MRDYRAPRPGEPKKISASMMGQMISATRHTRSNSINSSSSAPPLPDPFNRVQIVNAGGGVVRPQYSVCGLGGGPVFEPGSKEFQNQEQWRIFYFTAPAADGVSCAILQTPCAIDEYEWAIFLGLTPAYVDCTEVSDYGHCRTAAGNSTNLVGDPQGDIQILYRPEAGDEPRLCLVSLGVQQSSIGGFIPVDLEHIGGADGDGDTRATWSYRVTDQITGEEYYADVDISSGVHEFRRPYGVCTQATDGYAYRDSDNTVIVGWVDETFEYELPAPSDPLPADESNLTQNESKIIQIIAEAAEEYGGGAPPAASGGMIIKAADEVIPFRALNASAADAELTFDSVTGRTYLVRIDAYGRFYDINDPDYGIGWTVSGPASSKIKWYSEMTEGGYGGVTVGYFKSFSPYDVWDQANQHSHHTKTPYFFHIKIVCSFTPTSDGPFTVRWAGFGVASEAVIDLMAGSSIEYRWV